MEDDKLKKLIQEAGAEKAPDSFKEKIMSSLEVQAESEELKEKITLEIVKEGGVIEAPKHFAHNVMQQIHAEPVISYEPVISKKVWIGIAAFLAAIFGIAAFSNSGGTYEIATVDNANRLFDVSFGALTSFLQSLKISMPLIATIMCALVVVFSDFIISRLRKSL